MIPLVRHLDTTDFDALLAMARGRLPALARQWTDYNIHDPGIMLVELLAWLADTQVYSLARNRTDERLGFLTLMGARARGAGPAKGLVFPVESPEAAQPIVWGSVIRPARGGMPRLEADAAITLLPVVVRRIAAGPEGRDVTGINAASRASFAAFGEARPGDLRIELALTAPLPGDERVRLSLGFRVEGSRGDAPVERLGRVGAYAADGTRLRRLRDTTLGLQRSGAMVFDLAPGDLEAPIVLRPEAGYSLAPRLLGVQPNALPVEQRATVRLAQAVGTGGPGQTIDISPTHLLAAEDPVEGRIWRLVDGGASLRVSSLPEADRPVTWRRGRLDDAGPDDRCFAVAEAVDGSRLSLRFGNGVNGLRPVLGEPLSVTLVLCCGAGGGSAQPVDWVMERGGTHWRNPDAIGGGRDAQSPGDALAALRERVEARRPLATSGQIEAAALALPRALGVVRAHVEDGWERGRRAPALAATRTLIAVAARPGDEDAAWLRAIRRLIAPRIALGERLLVAAPVYRRFTLSIEIEAARGSRPADIAGAVRQALAERFDAAHNPWPFARDVSAAAIAGWVRKVPGVAGLHALRLLPAGEGERSPAGAERIVVGRGELPLLVGDPEVTAREQPQ